MRRILYIFTFVLGLEKKKSRVRGTKRWTSARGPDPGPENQPVLARCLRRRFFKFSLESEPSVDTAG